MDIFNVNAPDYHDVKQDIRSAPDNGLIRFNFHSFFFTYPFLLRKKKSDKLFVIFHGAKNRSDKLPPFFDRWSWDDIFDGSILNISDPSLFLDKNLRLAWYAGNQNEHALKVAAEIVTEIAVLLNIPVSNIFFWGSSGGGLAAIIASLLCKGSNAIVFNAQTNGVNYYQSHVDDLFKVCFDGDASMANKVDCSYWFDYLKNTESKIYLFQNKKDLFHYEKHFIPFFIKYVNYENVFFIRYTDNKGHGPEDKGLAFCTQLIVGELDRLYNSRKKNGFLDIDNIAFFKFRKSLINKRSPGAYSSILDFFCETNDSFGLDEFYRLIKTFYPHGWSLSRKYALALEAAGEYNKALYVLQSVLEKLKNSKNESYKKVLSDIVRIKKMLD